MTKLRNAQAELKAPGLEDLEVEVPTFGRRMLTVHPSTLRYRTHQKTMVWKRQLGIDVKLCSCKQNVPRCSFFDPFEPC